MSKNHGSLFNDHFILKRVKGMFVHTDYIDINLCYLIGQ